LTTVEIIFLCHRIPYPPNKGDKIRAFHILTHLMKSHRVHLGCFIDDPADYAHISKLKQLVNGDSLFVPLTKSAALPRTLNALLCGAPLTTAFFASGKMDAWVRDMLRAHAIDRAFLFSSAMAPFFLRQHGIDPGRVILDMVDVDSDKWRQYAAESHGPMKLIYRREADALLKLERRAAARFGATLFVSPYETASFLSLAPETTGCVHSVGNGVDLDYFSPAQTFPSPFAAGEFPIVMTGAMGYRPNTEGAIWFVKTVLPKVLEALPNARFYAVGANPTRTLRGIAHAHCVVTGSVADVRPYIAHAAAAIAPLHIARGVQNKVLEAMAMQKPVVATLAATRALEARPGKDLFVAAEPSDFAGAVIAAATGAARDSIAKNGRRYVETHHSWATQLNTLDQLLSSVTSFPHANAPHFATASDDGCARLATLPEIGIEANP
jgi:polysaccharide biosynthesis protein PslH